MDAFIIVAGYSLALFLLGGFVGMHIARRQCRAQYAPIVDGYQRVVREFAQFKEQTEKQQADQVRMLSSR